MTKLEELKAAYDAAEATYDAAEATYEAAYDAYKAELEKQGEKKNDLALSTDETHRDL